MLNYEIIKKLLSENFHSNEHFYKKIDLTRVGYNRMIDNKSMKVETLEKIAQYFEKPIAFFFNEVTNERVEDEDKRLLIDFLKKENAELKKEIERLKMFQNDIHTQHKS